MEQHGFDKQPDAEVEVEPWGERLVKGLAIDLAFGVILVIAFAVTEDFGIAFLATMGTIVAAYVAWRILSGAGHNSPPKE